MAGQTKRPRRPRALMVEGDSRLKPATIYADDYCRHQKKEYYIIRHGFILHTIKRPNRGSMHQGLSPKTMYHGITKILKGFAPTAYPVRTVRIVCLI